MYQRNYAWDEGEITQLIQDVIDYSGKTNSYYIGTLVVYERTKNAESTYEVIDGQQRLTTLALLASYLKKDSASDVVSWYKNQTIRFESRDHSGHTLDAIFNGDDPMGTLDPSKINTAILNGYNLIVKNLHQKLDENVVSPQRFSEFLSKNVQVMRVNVPTDTNLNHYFEIMNNRGEQLEKHEILKSKMMEILRNDRESQHCLHIIWEACANMEKYVQMCVPKKLRDAVFGSKDWSKFEVNDFADLREKIGKWHMESPESTSEQFLDEASEETLDQIIKPNRVYRKAKKGDEASERFSSVINFPNFLLHVLRIQTESDLPLDDKRLIPVFHDYILRADNATEKVKNFAFDLLRCKFLYDSYIIKREFIKGKEGWSLKRLKWQSGELASHAGRAYYESTFKDTDENESNNKRILMLLSAFHVSTPTLVYKHWLNAALHYLFTTETILADAYLTHLESVAKSFVFDRFLSVNEGLEYFDIIYKKGSVCQTRLEDISNSDMESNLRFGNIQSNLIFNFLDYFLWVKCQANDDSIKNYEFTFRSSVEHYYPKKPLGGHDKLPDSSLNSFGNLCLISHSKNSRLSNYMPIAKKNHYQNAPIDSVKQHLMMNNYGEWDENSIKAHFDEMKSVLLGTLESAEKPA